MKKFLAILLAAMLTAFSLTACGAPAANPSSTAPEANDSSAAASAPAEGTSPEKTKFDLSKEVEVSMYIVNDEPSDYGTMLAELNKKLKADLNCTLKVNFIGWSDYQTRYPLLLSSGEPIDLIYAATWIDFYALAQKGAFMPLEDLLPKYCAESWPQADDMTKIQATVNGHIYAFPNGKEDYSAYGLSVRGDLMDKYKIPPIKTFEDYGNFLKIIKENEPDMQPTNLYSYGSMFDSVYMQSKGLYSIDGGVYWIDPSQENPKVFNLAEWDGMPGFLDMMKKWFDAGYWPASALSNQDSKMLETGKSASDMNNLGHWAGYTMEAPQYEFRWFELTNNINILSHIQDAIAVPAAAKNPERGLMVLNRLRSDRSYFDLFTYGVPGVHSEIQPDGSVKALSPETFPMDPSSWGLRTQEFYRDQAGMPADYQKYLKEIRDQVKPNKFRSFYMNTDAVKNEYAAVQNAMTQYFVPLKMGYVEDPVKGLAEFKAQLEAAGDAKIKAELQRQVDEFNTLWK